MDKWQELKSLIDASISWDVHYSFERPVERNYMHKVRQWMDELDKREKEETSPKGFLFDDIPTFDKKTWERLLKELQGLS